MKYAVAGMNFWDNELSIEIIEADTWKDALGKHRIFKTEEDDNGLDWLSEDVKSAKEDAFNADMAFDVVEIVESPT